MPFTLIKGTFHVINYSPDGDSIRFKPNDPAHLRNLNGAAAKMNVQGHTQLRVEAIDALETHYSPPSGGGPYHQPLAMASEARSHLIKFLGFTEVIWDSQNRIVLAASKPAEGYILSRATDKYGRPIAFLFAGSTDEADGADVMLKVDALSRSYNYASIFGGLTYPTFYTGLFSDLRGALTAAVISARSNRLGIHDVDMTSEGFEVNSLQSITETVTILPKLFRRLVEYVGNVGSAAGFKEALALANEKVFDLRTANFTHLDTFVEQASGSSRLRFTRRAEELVFDETPTALQPFSQLMLSMAHEI